jgi:nitrite reductase/ring-hydroxylating ferredoxin subunit
MEWHRVAGRDELVDGSTQTVDAGGVSVALTRLGERYGALNDFCPHAGASLGSGSVEGGMIVCPWHGWAFDAMTGECALSFEKAVTYPVEVRDDGIYIGIE